MASKTSPKPPNSQNFNVKSTNNLGISPEVQRTNPRQIGPTIKEQINKIRGSKERPNEDSIVCLGPLMSYYSFGNRQHSVEQPNSQAHPTIFLNIINDTIDKGQIESKVAYSNKNLLTPTQINSKSGNNGPRVPKSNL